MRDGLDELAARHVGSAPGDVRAACPNCDKGGRDDAVSVTIEGDGHVVAHCHRCGENGSARPHRANGKRPAARIVRPPEDHDALWASGVEPGEAFEHAYLTRKQVGAHGIRISGDVLLVPMRNIKGELVGVQKIAADGTKLYTRGAKKTGAYHSIGGVDKAVVVAEGYATGATIYEATGIATAIAFDCANLEPVAKALRSKYPTTRIILAADDDHRTDDNPGMAKATAAARAVGGLLAAPDFGDDRPDGATDFNDLAQLRSAEAVKGAIAAAKPMHEARELITVGGIFTVAASMPELTYIREPLFIQGQVITLTAHPGHGKSTVAVREAFDLLDRHPVGLVYFVSAEDMEGTKLRACGEAIRRGFTADDRARVDARLRWVHVNNIASPPLIREYIEPDAAGRRVLAVFVDTGPALFPGDDESANVEMQRFATACRVLTDLPGHPCVTVFWHPTKNATADNLAPRGGSALLGAVDGNLTLWLDTDSGITTLRHSPSKWRGDHFEPIAFRFEPVEIVLPSGRVRTIKLAAPTEDRAPAVRKAKVLNSTAKIALDALRTTLSDHGQRQPGTSTIPPGTVAVTLDQWRSRFHSLVTVEPTDDRKEWRNRTDARRKAFERARNDLLAAGICGTVNDYWWLS